MAVRRNYKFHRPSLVPHPGTLTPGREDSAASVEQSLKALCPIMSASGHKRTNLRRPKIYRCPLLSESAQNVAVRSAIKG
jgi:hypothetical protein